MNDERHVERTNLVLQIESTLEIADVVVLVGEPGYGKTTLACEFASGRLDQCVRLFIRGSSTFAYAPDYAQDALAQELSRVLGIPSENVDQRTYHQLIRAVQRAARQKPIFFVVDGWEEIPQEDARARAEIMDKLPLGLPNLRFVLSAAPDLNLENRHLDVRPISMPPFTHGEFLQYIAGHEEVPAEHSSELYSIARGIPGRCASIRRLLDTGKTVAEIVSHAPTELSHLFDLEWNSISQDHVTLAAFLAHSRAAQTIEDLARLTKFESAKVEKLAESVGFLNVDANGVVAFSGASFKRYAQQRTQKSRQDVVAELAKDLMSLPPSDQTLTCLPGYLHDAGISTELIGYLSASTLRDVLEKHKSMGPIAQALRSGLRTAVSAARIGAIIRFGLILSALQDLKAASGYRKEVEAYIGLWEFDCAFSVAQSAPLKEDRLLLLSVIARGRKEAQLEPDPQLLDQIRRLYSELDIDSLQMCAADLAAELLYVDPNLAAKLVRKAQREVDGLAADAAVAGISIEATSFDDDGQFSSAIDEFRSTIVDPGMLALTGAASALFGATPADEFLHAIEALSDRNLQSILIRRWCVRNRRREDAHRATAVGIDLLVKTAELTPTARHLRELAEPLPYCRDANATRQLTRILDGLREDSYRHGPTADAFRIQLLCAEAEWNTGDKTLAQERVIDCYLLAESELSEPVSQVECLAYLVALLSRSNLGQVVESKDSLLSLAERELDTSVDELLGNSASQYTIFRRTIAALVPVRLDLAQRLAERLNTQPRRDAATRRIAEKYCAVAEEVDLSVLSAVLEKIDDDGFRVDATVDSVACVASRGTSLTLTRPDVLEDMVSTIEDATARCAVASDVVRIQQNANVKPSPKMLALVEKAWNSTSLPCSKVEAALDLASALGGADREVATLYFRKSASVRSESAIYTRSLDQIAFSVLRLVVSAYSGLLPKGLDSPADLDRLNDLLTGRLCHSRARCVLWADLAIRMLQAKRREAAGEIVRTRVLPTLEEIAKDDVGAVIATKVRISPAVFVAQPTVWKDEAARWPGDARDTAIRNIFATIISGGTILEPCDIKRAVSDRLTIEEVFSLIGICEIADSDSLLYWAVRRICEVFVRAPEAAFTREQRTRVAQHIDELGRTSRKNRFIQHDGYGILMEATAAIVKNRRADLAAQAKRAEGIPNIADKAFVFAELASLCSSGKRRASQQYLDEARNVAKAIPSAYDRIDRLALVARAGWKVNVDASKEILREAMKECMGNRGAATRGLESQIVDLAFQVDPELAERLAKLADDDPARAGERARLSRDVRTLREAQGSTIDGKGEDGELGRAAWLALSSLNAGSRPLMGIPELGSMVRRAAEVRLSDSFPAFALAIANLTVKYGGTEQASTILREVFEDSLASANVLESLFEVGRTEIAWPRSDGVSGGLETDGVFVGFGERDRVVAYLRNWLAENVKSSLLVCDPYFGVEELAMLRWVMELAPSCGVRVLGHALHQRNSGVLPPYRQAFEAYWRNTISLSAPPNTEIFLVEGERSGKFPVHDRWWLGDSAGLRMGTSLNSCGWGKLSELSRMTPMQSETARKRIEDYTLRRVRQHGGERLISESFTL